MDRIRTTEKGRKTKSTLMFFLIWIAILFFFYFWFCFRFFDLGFCFVSICWFDLDLGNSFRCLKVFFDFWFVSLIWVRSDGDDDLLGLFYNEQMMFWFWCFGSVFCGLIQKNGKRNEFCSLIRGWIWWISVCVWFFCCSLYTPIGF
jgi:hypothetical protein